MDGDTGQCFALEKTFPAHARLLCRGSSFTYINTFVTLSIVYFYYTVWRLEILAPRPLFIKG